MLVFRSVFYTWTKVHNPELTSREQNVIDNSALSTLSILSLILFIVDQWLSDPVRNKANGVPETRYHIDDHCDESMFQWVSPLACSGVVAGMVLRKRFTRSSMADISPVIFS
ncbi:hypothetical protein GCM10023116_29690 [Kistimonas scapharcae]|uniref:Uncharacterized protein n=1 Tax=Kistimonas scapharcae TaxID=1036133 RepID=A0ABP8V4F8_9GAMM